MLPRTAATAFGVRISIDSPGRIRCFCTASTTLPLGSRHSLSMPEGMRRRSTWSAVQRTVATVGMPSEAASPAGDKCLLYPQSQPIQGSADPLTGTITLVVPASVLKQLSGTDAAGRPVEQPAAAGARFYDGTAFSFANTTSPAQAAQSFLYTLDSTPAMDFTLPKGR